MGRKINLIILHHTASPRDTTTESDVRRWHEERGLGEGIAYHFTILNSGEVKQTRSPDKIGNHCWGKNENSIGVALCGNFMEEHPTKNQLWTLADVLIKLCKRFNLSPQNITYHSKIALPGHETKCPGKYLIEEIPGLLSKLMIKLSYPARPPDPDKSPTAEAEEKLRELTRRDIITQSALNLTLWGRFWLWIRGFYA